MVDVSQLSGRTGSRAFGLSPTPHLRPEPERSSPQPIPKTIPTIAVVEEAQSVLNERATAAEPYIQWVKEGRKYDSGRGLGYTAAR